MATRPRRIAAGALLALSGLALNAHGAGTASTAATAGVAAKAEPPAVRLLGEGRGRFDIVAEAGGEGWYLAELAEHAWERWRAPLGLPARLPVGITVRLIPEREWRLLGKDAEVVAGAGGVVTVWIKSGGETGLVRERGWLRALAEGAWRRKAVLEGIRPDVAIPRWLVDGAAEAVVVTRRPSMLDAWQAALRAQAPALRLREVLLGKSGEEGAEARAAASFGVWRWLREDCAQSGDWGAFTRGLLAGESPGAVLAREYARVVAKPAEAREWELAWRVAAARLASARTTPTMEAGESRRRLEQLARIVAWDARAGRERILPLAGEWETRRETWVREELADRARLLASDLGRMHPFYRNAAVSLGRCWLALAQGEAQAWREASAEWDSDWTAGRELEEASARLLDGAGPGN